MLKQVLSSRANSSVKKYVAQYRLFCLYMKSRGLRLVLPCDSYLYLNTCLIFTKPKNHMLLFCLRFVR